MNRLVEPFEARSSSLQRENSRAAFDDVLAAIQVHGEDLINFPDVISVAPGYRFKNGQITSEPALIVTVLRKHELGKVPSHKLLPSKLGKVIVDVVPATALQQWKFVERQRELAQSASQIVAGIIDTSLPSERLDGLTAPAVAAAIVKYVPPNEPLIEINEEMRIICHASPDAGWKNLREFIEGTNTRLTATMYEFNARHVLDSLLSSLKTPRKLRLILDGGADNAVPGPAATTVSKAAAREALQTALQQRFAFVWAAVSDDGKTTSSFFPSAYHIKVAVRDNESVWLSSGNWKESGQPRVDPINGPFPPDFEKTEFLEMHNREWHVIIHNLTLAKLFETFINHDISQAAPLQKVGALPLPAINPPDLFIPIPEAPSTLAAIGPEFFPHGGDEFDKKVRVQPLMTPDNFVELVLPLIENATKSLYFQNQSLKPSNSNTRYRPLFEALRDKSKQASEDFDIKILVSEFTDLTLLKAAQFNMKRVKVQHECHNKGIIIDDKIVLVGSHNWTGQGATQNRDASLIIHDDEIAAYFRQFFLFDWNRISEGQHLLPPPRVALPGEQTPPDMIRVAWEEVYPDWREALID